MFNLLTLNPPDQTRLGSMEPVESVELRLDISVQNEATESANGNQAAFDDDYLS